VRSSTPAESGAARESHVGAGPGRKLGAVTPYLPEEFTAPEVDLLRRYFTNVDGPVFALVNLPELVKGALMSRYSRSPKSLRRLFLDEFVGDLDVSGDVGVDATVGIGRAEAFYEKNFVEYGDDSIAQLGGVHLACEQASNVLTKILEWGRLLSYIEQSTRYINYDLRLGGRYRFHRDPGILNSALGTRYVADMDRTFEAYTTVVQAVIDHLRATVPQLPTDSDFVYRQAIRAKALDAARGMLPASTLSNLGIYGSGQGYENLLLRMRAHPLPEARAYADLMLLELRKVIPTFMRRVDLPDRGVVWSNYLASTRDATASVAHRLFTGVAPDDVAEVTLLDWDPNGEDKVIAAALYPHLSLSEAQILAKVRTMSTDDKASVLRASVGDRQNRRHKPGRAFERTDYRFDVLGDYGAFRDLQRHRLMTIDWQRLSPDHGFSRPDLVDEAGVADLFNETMERSADLYTVLAPDFPAEASYAVSMAYRVRYIMQFNAREAMHMLELRTAPQGHPSYRRVCLEMHRLIADQAGHRAIAAAMTHVNSADPGLERLQAERQAEKRRTLRAD
jgi:thymidylate synthase ThyX